MNAEELDQAELNRLREFFLEVAARQRTPKPEQTALLVLDLLNIIEQLRAAPVIS